MIRLCCLSLSFQPQFTARQLNDLSFIDLCGQLQLDGVDFNIASLATLERDHLRKVKKACLERGLTIACLGVNNDFGRPAAEQDAVLQRVRQGIDVAQFLGAPLVRLFAGAVRAAETREVIWHRAIEGLRRAADYGEKAGVVVGLQNHNHNNITSTGDDTLRLLDQVKHPWCRHILDTGQYLGSPGAGGARPEDARRYDLYQSIAQTAPRAVLVRAKLYRLRSGREAQLDYPRIFKILRGVRYNGFVCLVYEGWKDMDATHAVPVGVTFLRNLLREVST
jgi:sugar phosphate isomerase/epimerase